MHSPYRVISAFQVLACLFAFALCASATSVSAQDKAERQIDFNRDILPILSDRCFACHGPDDNTREADLRLDIESAVLDPDGGPVVPNDAKASTLVERIFSDDEDLVMPPPSTNKPLSSDDKEKLVAWINEGAKWSKHWAYVAPDRVTTNDITSNSVAEDNPIDVMIRKRLGPASLEPSQEADRITLIRRLYFDLIGLPPTPAQVNAFVEDQSPDAYQKVVEELLESPHFGERLAIYWLDVVRFADSNGYHSDEARQIAPYRDYVIEAFNRNMPYDQFVIEQLAGDLLPNPTVSQQVASGFNMLLQTTSEGGAQAKEYIAKYAADRVRNTSQIFLGSTLGCAECHNHKFDPFTQKDFYSFAAFFADIQQPAVGNPPTFPVVTEADTARIAEFDQEIAAIRERLKATTPELKEAQLAWEKEQQSVVATEPKLSGWHQIGPFAAADFNAAFEATDVDPAAIDLDGTVGDRKWETKDYADGTPHALSMGSNSSVYLYRTITVDRPQSLKLSLGSDDGISVWVNGERVHHNKANRGVAADQDEAVANLREGSNQLLVKITNGGGAAGFYFKTAVNSLPPAVVVALSADADGRSVEQQQAIDDYYRTIAPLLQEHRDELAKREAAKKQFVDARPRTMMTKTGKPREVKLLNRGDWLDDSGPVMQPAIPEFLGTIETEKPRLDRLDLAHWIVDPTNPLTSRTFVNRLWKLYFGQGLAKPLDDFGRQGTLPSHPELLDYLAIEFVESEWDIKHMIRLIVMSETYRQSSMVSEEQRQRDPYNELYARQTRFRLEAEIIRDNALALSGLLVRDIGGRSVYPYQPAGYWSHMNFPTRTWPQDSGASLYRRGVYTWWQRMFLHPAMQAFDAPSREECTVERPRSNIPQQALVLLNDPVYVEAARVLAERIVQEGGDSPEDRIVWAWRVVTSREPEPREIEIVKSIFDKHAAEYAADQKAAEQLLSVGNRPYSGELNAGELAAWTSVARVLLNLHETINRP